jgi:phenylpropionate dioxygenase-like ring-hydroxylating dioxygenase large terminal subunit
MNQAFTDQVYARLESERNRRDPPPEFARLPLIPAGRYTDPDFLALERQHLWKKSWLYACHADELPDAGSFQKWDKTGSPIFIVRDGDRVIRAFYNTCRHRGAPLVTETSGQAQGGFTCGYHGWSYDLAGRLIGMRDRRDFGDLDFSCMGLIPVRCERLGKWVFINEDPEAPGLEEYLGPIHGHLQQFDLDRIRHVASYSFEVECSVKVMLDAFLEVYHLKSIHQETVDRFLDHHSMAIWLWENGHSMMVTPYSRPDWVDPGTRGMLEFPNVTELPVKTNLSYNIYPNLVTPVAGTGMPLINFWPRSDNSMNIECHWFSPDWGDGDRHPLWDTRIANFDRILDEDMQFAPRIQRSLESPGFRGIQLNYQERRIYHWHEELDRCIGVENIPPDLRVEPRLAALVE